jgi:hypothetical protein
MRIGRVWAIWPYALFFTGVIAMTLALTRFSTPHTLLRWLCAAVAVVALPGLAFFLNLKHKRAARSSSTHSSASQSALKLSDLIKRQHAAIREDNIAAIPSLIQMITQPTDYRTRTSESIWLQGLVVEQRVETEFTFPPDQIMVEATTQDPASIEDLYVPVLLPRKHESTDNLVITDGQDQSISTLCYDETVNILAFALRLLIFSFTPRQPGGGRTQTDEQRDAELLLLNLIYSADPPRPDDLAREIRIAFEWLGIDETAIGERKRKHVDRLRQFVTILSHAYPIIAVIPYEQGVRRLSISYRRTTIPALPRRDRRTQLRLVLGLRPFKVQVNTALAQVAKSYHLHVLGPGSQYLMEQTLGCPGCGGTLTTDGVKIGEKQPGSHRNFADIKAEKPYYELRGKRGQSYAHLYMRGFAHAQGESLILSTSFGETPPGTLAGAAVTAAMSCLLIGAVGHAQMAGISHGSDIPPLLLALPTVAASWFGFAADTEEVLRSSLAARCSLLLGGVLSLVAAAIFLVTSRPEGGPLPATPPSLLGMHLPSWWAALFLVAAANMLYVLIQLLVRTSSYRRLLLRREPDAYDTASQTPG